MKKPFGIFITSPEAIPLIEMVYPPAKKLDYVKDLHKMFIVFNYPKAGNTRIMSRKAFNELFKDSEYGNLSIRLI